MRAAAKAVVPLVALFLIFLLAPVFPYTAASGSAFGIASVSVTADVSLTFLLFHCGSVLNARLTGSLAEFAGSVPLTQGYRFICNFGIG